MKSERNTFVRCGLRGTNEHKGEFAMTYFYDTLQQGPLHNWQQMGQINPQFGQLFGAWLGNPGQAAYGQQYGQHSQYGNPNLGSFGHNAGWGSQPQWGMQQSPWGQWWGQQQRQLSPQDVNEVVRQLVPALPQILAQAQQPYPALAYAAYGQAPRTLTQQDVNDVVRQLLPLVPQIVGALQGQPFQQQFAMHGGMGGLGQGHLGQNQNPLATFQQGQYGWPQFQPAFGVPQQWGQSQRQLTQQDVADVTRQLIGIIPQVISNLQAVNQQRMI
jgi:hypothetical protein